MPIFGYRVLILVPDYKIGEGLIFLLLERVTHQTSSEERVSFPVLPIKDELLNFRQRLVAAFHYGGIWTAGPIGIFVELNLLLVGPAEDHRAEPAVADRQCVLPLVSGMRIPKHESGVWSGGCFRMRCEGSYTYPQNHQPDKAHG